MKKILFAFLLGAFLLTSCGSADAVINPGEALTLPETYIRKNCEIRCHISLHDIDTIRIGRGYVYQSHYLDITKDSLTVYRKISGFKPIMSIAHDFPIAGELNVTLTSDESNKCKLTLSSRKEERTYELPWWGGGEPFVRNLSDEPVSASLSFESSDYGQPVWIMGDSYINWLDYHRWPYYLFKWGHHGWMADHLPGGGSERFIQCFKNDLEYTDLRPKFAVWTMGMNDPSDKDISSPDEKWLSCVDEFLQLCRENGITPILSTIPSVPTRRHDAKTEWVRKSGIRHIDFAAAVDPDGDGVWLDGMLYKDGVHPSPEGAEAMARKVIEDFPEIAAAKEGSCQ